MAYWRYRYEARGLFCRAVELHKKGEQDLNQQSVKSLAFSAGEQTTPDAIETAVYELTGDQLTVAFTLPAAQSTTPLTHTTAKN